MSEQCEYTPKMGYSETPTTPHPIPNEQWQYQPGDLDASYAYDYGSTPTTYDVSLADHIAAIKRSLPPD